MSDVPAIADEGNGAQRHLVAMAVVEALPDAAWLVDGATLRITAANEAAERLFAAHRQMLVGQDVRTFSATPEDLAFWDGVASGDECRIQSDTSVTRHDGEVIPVMRHAAPLVEGERRWLLVTLRDRRAEVRAETERDKLIAELRTTLESTADGILVTDLNGRIQAFNHRFAQLWSLPDELLQQRDDGAIYSFMHGNVTDPDGYHKRLATIQRTSVGQSRDTIALRSGQVLERVTTPQWKDDQPIGRVYCFRDHSEKVEADRRIGTMAHTDALTGLPNRQQLTHRLAYALALARRDNTPFALLHLDVDHFRHINDSFGDGVGDRILLETTERILRGVREVDVVARVGGDSFVVLAHHADAHGAEITARRLLEAMSEPFTIEGSQFTLTCSIGISLYPNDGSTAEVLLRHAESAMRNVKDGARASFNFHQPQTEVNQRSRMKLDHAMRQGLAQGRFRLHYQPQVDLTTGTLVGAEALLRWHDPELGNVSPAEFIPVAEESGFIVALGQWVLETAVKQAAQWMAQGWRVPIAINVSALQFRQPSFVQDVADVLAAHDVPADMIELELTESILLRDADGALQRLQALSFRGIRLAIDDFGTGYSSLGYLKRLPISRLKIDRSFVAGLPGDTSDAGIVRAVMQLARALHIRVVAEGVETLAQREFLQEAGCDEYQGFLFATALDTGAFEQRLAEPARH